MTHGNGRGGNTTAVVSNGERPLLAPGCVYRGFCNYGCSTNAKSSILVTYIPRAIHAGAEIRPNAMVARIEHDASGRVTGVLHFRNGSGDGHGGPELFARVPRRSSSPAMPSKRRACC
jgi:hypothetical protein